MSDPIIPVNIPLFKGNEEKYLMECIRTGWVSSEGHFIKSFEETMASYVDRAFGIAVANGSAALDIAVAALEIGKGDEVIMPTFTIISPALSVIRAGAVPILVDCDAETWNMDVSQIEAKITSKTKAIIVVHIYGLPVDMDPVLSLCKKYGLYLIEDAAEMHGQQYKGKKCGSFGDISTFSFYPNKHITTGEGGMVLCNDEQLAERCRKLRNLSFETTGRRFIHFEMGWNYRMTNMQAALGLAQLENIDQHINIKKYNGNIYQTELKNLNSFQLPLTSTNYADNIYWVFGLVARNEDLCNMVVKKLNDKQIGTRPFFWCMHEQPIFIRMGFFKEEVFPVAEQMARCGFYLPSGLGLSEKDIYYVTNYLNSICD
jgi:perosamine synthetase